MKMLAIALGPYDVPARLVRDLLEAKRGLVDVSGRPFRDLRRASRCHRPSLGQNEDLVTDRRRLLGMMRREHDGRETPQPIQQTENAEALANVEPRHRLVQQEEPGRVNHGVGDARFLLHSRGISGGAPIVLSKAERVEEPVGVVGRLDALEGQTQRQCVFRSLEEGKGGGVLRHVRHIPLSPGLDRFPVDPHLTCRGGNEPGDHLEQ